MKVTITTRLTALTPGYADKRQSLLTAVAGARDASLCGSTTVPTVTGRKPVTIIARGDPDRVAAFVAQIGQTLAARQLD